MSRSLRSTVDGQGQGRGGRGCGRVHSPQPRWRLPRQRWGPRVMAGPQRSPAEVEAVAAEVAVGAVAVAVEVDAIIGTNVWWPPRRGRFGSRRGRGRNRPGAGSRPRSLPRRPRWSPSNAVVKAAALAVAKVTAGAMGVCGRGGVFWCMPSENCACHQRHALIPRVMCEILTRIVNISCCCRIEKTLGRLSKSVADSRLQPSISSLALVAKRAVPRSNDCSSQKK